MAATAKPCGTEEMGTLKDWSHTISLHGNITPSTSSTSTHVDDVSTDLKEAVTRGG